MLRDFKPYLWVKVDTTLSAKHQLYFYIQLPPGSGLDTAITEETIDDRLIVKFKVISGSAPTTPVNYTLSGYNPSVHHKVTVKIVDGLGVIKGLATAYPTTTYFSGSELYNVPYCWLEYINTSTSYLHFRVKLHSQHRINIAPVVTDSPALNRRTIKYQIVSDPSVLSESLQDFSFALDLTTGYDPIYEFILVELTNDATPSADVGTGTTEQSEADASGDGFVV